MSTDFKIVIPARYDSNRFPGKPLADIHGKPMIQRVYENAIKSDASEVIIATDSIEIGQKAEAFGAVVCMTSTQHTSGTERIGEVAEKNAWDNDVVVVNLQGDEPLTPIEVINQVANNLIEHSEADCATLCTPVHSIAEARDPNIVKVVMDANGLALYFSRAMIPFHRDADCDVGGDELPYFRHIGMYAYRTSLLRKFHTLPECALEKIEKLEQLRLMWNGYRIHVAEAISVPGHGVDTPEDLEKVKANMNPKTVVE